MKVYRCDCCNKTIDNPYIERMKEFKVSFDYPFDSHNIHKKRRMHLCENCFKGLYSLGEKVSLSEGNVLQVKKSKWEKYQDTIQCAHCGFGQFKAGYYFMDGECISADDGKFTPSYCPNCGAKMDGLDSED